MPRLIDLLTAEEVSLLRLVPSMTVSLDEFLASAVASRGVANQLMYALLQTIPGVDVGPIPGDYTWVSPYLDYAGWLAWFLNHRGAVVRRSVDLELAQALNIERINRAGSDEALRAIATDPAWLNREVGSLARAGGPKPPRSSGRRRRSAENPLGQGAASPARANPLRRPPATAGMSNPLRVSGSVTIGSRVETRAGRVGVIDRIEGRCYYLSGSQACHYREDLTPL